MYRTCHSKIKAKTASLVLMSLSLSLNIHAQSPTREELIEDAEASTFPSVDELVKAKRSNLEKRLAEQSKKLVEVEENLLKEQQLEEQIFDTKAYLRMAMFNSSPQSEYQLVSTEVLVNGKTVSLGGEGNQGLPRNNPRLFYAPLSPGCHEVKVKAHFSRRKKDTLVSRIFKVKQEMDVERELTIIAQEGHIIDLDIEAFEAVPTIVKWYRNPDIRFNPSHKPNFLSGSPLASMNGVIEQGQLRIDYQIGDSGNYRLLTKSVAIDGLPILNELAHNEGSEKSTIFNAPLAEGKHKMQVTLLFGQERRVEGGASYNFRLNFEREFDVASGYQTTINLLAMPDSKITLDPYNTRYARVSSAINSEADEAFFPQQSCRELRRNKAIPQASTSSNSESAAADAAAIAPMKEPKSDNAQAPGV